MTANKNSPAEGHERNYRSSSLSAELRYGRPYNHNRPSIDNSAHQEDALTNDENLDQLIWNQGKNESYQGRPHPTDPGNAYDLSQPVWFYMIMKKLAAEKKKKK